MAYVNGVKRLSSEGSNTEIGRATIGSQLCDAWGGVSGMGVLSLEKGTDYGP